MAGFTDLACVKRDMLLSLGRHSEELHGSKPKGMLWPFFFFKNMLAV